MVGSNAWTNLCDSPTCCLWRRDGLGADSEDRETQLSQLELESSDGGRLMMLRKNKGSGYSLGSGKSVVLEEAPGGGVRIALEENTYHTTWGDMDYDRGDADHDMDAAIVQWEVERDDETMRMLLDRWTWVPSQVPPSSPQCDARKHPTRIPPLLSPRPPSTQTHARTHARTLKRTRIRIHNAYGPPQPQHSTLTMTPRLQVPREPAPAGERPP